MKNLLKIFNNFKKPERLIFWGMLIIFLTSSATSLLLFWERNTKPIAKEGGEFREGIIGQPKIINPIISLDSPDKDISSLIYLNLLDLAENYQVKQDKQYTIQLQQNLKWSDSMPLTADDVIFTVNLIQNPKTNSPLFSSWQYVKVKRISQLKVEFTLPEPYSFFLDNLSRLYILPKHIFGKIPPQNISLSEYNLAPIGNGPFKFDHLKKNKFGFIEEYHLIRNPFYNQRQPYLNKLIFKFYQAKSELIQAFNQREIDGFGTIAPINLTELKTKKSVHSIILPDYYAVFFNFHTQPSLNQKKLRKYLANNLNKKVIIDKVLFNQALEINNPTVPGFSNYVSIQNEDKKESFDNLDQSLEFSLLVPEIDFLLETAKQIKSQWEKIGIKLNLNVVNLQQIKLAIETRDYQMLLFGIRPVPNMDLFPFWHSSEKFSPGLNLSLYSNPEVDELIEEIRKDLQSQERKEKFKSLISIISEDKPAIFLFSPKYIYVTTQKLKGFNQTKLVEPSNRFKKIQNWYINTTRVFLS